MFIFLFLPGIKKEKGDAKIKGYCFSGNSTDHELRNK